MAYSSADVTTNRNGSATNTSTRGNGIKTGMSGENMSGGSGGGRGSSSSSSSSSSDGVKEEVVVLEEEMNWIVYIHMINNGHVEGINIIHILLILRHH